VGHAFSSARLSVSSRLTKPGSLECRDAGEGTMLYFWFVSKARVLELLGEAKRMNL
jgi:hypothetical protein